MKKLLRYLKDYRKESVLGPLFKLLEATLELFVPLVVAAIIDTGIGNQDRSYVVKMCFVLVLFGIIGLAFFYHCPVFCGKGGGWFCDKDTSRPVCAYSEAFLCGAGYTGNIDTDHQNDQ